MEETPEQRLARKRKLFLNPVMVSRRFGTDFALDTMVLNEEERLVVIRFGYPETEECVAMDEQLSKIIDVVKNFAAIYCANLGASTDPPGTPLEQQDDPRINSFNVMYELYDPQCVMFFFRNKHMMCDFGTGNNNKLNFLVNDKQELIDVMEVIYKGAKKGKGLVVSPKDYSTRHQY